MNNGNKDGGCEKGNDCDYLHPKICPSSFKNKTCKFIDTDKKCTRGYHLKNTKSCRDKKDKPMNDFLGMMKTLVDKGGRESQKKKEEENNPILTLLSLIGRSL